MFYKLVARCLFSNQNYCIITTCLKWSSTCFRISMRVIGPLMLLLANALIFGVAYIFFTRLLPRTSGESPLLYWLHAFIGAFLLVNVIFNYISCAFTSPGSPEPCLDPGKYFGQMSSVIDNRIFTQIRSRLDLVPGVSYRYCRHCSCIKPPRSHHCSVSGKCVLNMDHFCPWMSNCVGYHNYRYFVLFLFYLFMGSLYVGSITLGPFLAIHPNIRHTVSAFDSIETLCIEFSLLMALSAGIAVGTLLGWHVYLCLTNQTTIEFYTNLSEKHDAKLVGETYRNPFDAGWRKNLKRVFGDVPWYLALCLSRRQPPPPEYPLLPEEAAVSTNKSSSTFSKRDALSRV